MSTPETGTRRRPPWVGGCSILALTALGLMLVLYIVGQSVRTKAPGAASSGGLGFGTHVGLIRLEGDIVESRRFIEELDELRNDSRVRALVIRIDSPGGGVAATQEIHQALRDYHEETGQPMVASLGSIAASGGYYAACAAQRIVSEPGTLTGSIGVILTFADASELMRKVGLRVEVVKSGPRKDFGSPWRPLTDDERQMLQDIVGDVYGQFTEAVATGREQPLEQVLEWADGRIFSGRQAVAAGLADTLGYEDDAVSLAANLAGLSPDTPALSKRRELPAFLEWLDRITGRARVLLSSGPRLEYRLAVP